MERRECVPVVVNEIGKQRNAAGQDEDDGLSDRGGTEDRQRQAYRADPLMGALDAVVNQAVRVSVGVVVVVVRASMRVRVLAATVAMPLTGYQLVVQCVRVRHQDKLRQR